ncbi:MAG: RagB/SusD family nutrient uptake outer membrane protein [Flavisolibacter sp.]
MFHRKFRYDFLVLATALFFVSCRKWVDEKPPLQIDQNEIFSSDQGFREVLNGVYLQMGNRSLYGRDLTTGLLSILGRSYDTTISPAIGNLFYQAARYNFQDADVRNTFKNIWDSTYFCIGNLNNLLQNIESRKNVLSPASYNLYKGEALGLRAFLHFDLLRMFAPAPAASGLNTLAIPYATQLSPYASPAFTTATVIDSCIADLNNAQSLLGTADNTTSHFTIWAVKGLLARIYLYKGDFANAQSSALAVINSNKFPLSTSNSDLMFTKEHLFSLYSSISYAIAYNKSVFNTNPPLGFTTLSQTALFVTGGGSATDWRKSFLDPLTGVALGNTISPRKYYSSGQSTVNVLPMIRATEMYYIAAESANALQDSLTATSMLDSVRVHRNLVKYTQTALKRDSINIEIAKEYQKEFLGEGQMFYFYKRKNLPITSLPYTKVPVVSNASYVFIKPE